MKKEIKTGLYMMVFVAFVTLSVLFIRTIYQFIEIIPMFLDIIKTRVPEFSTEQLHITLFITLGVTFYIMNIMLNWILKGIFASLKYLKDHKSDLVKLKEGRG
jgi:hypothetical protein